MKFKFLVLASLISISNPGFASSVKRTTLNFDCQNKSEKALQKTLSLSVTISTYNTGKKSIWAEVETKRDIFDLNPVKGDAAALETDSFSNDIGGVYLDASYQLKLSAPINEQLSAFDASWKLLINDQVANLGEGVFNPEQFSCHVVAAKVSTISAELKAAANNYIKNLGDEWNVEGKKMTEYDFSKGFLGKEKRRMDRTGDYSLDGHKVQLNVNGEKVTVFVVIASQEESASLTVYTDKGEFISDIEVGD